MKRLFKALGIVLLVLILLVGGFAAYISIKGIPTYEVELPAELASLEVTLDSARIERGAKIASMLCKECHAGENGRLTGAIMVDLPAEFGEVATYNITKDPEHGIGKWTDGELYYFLRTGARVDGTYAPPYMPKFPLMADEDLYSVIAWLRSDDPVLEADSREYPPNQPNFLVKMLSNFVFKPLPLPEKTLTIPDTTDMVAFGEYVADGLINCFGCHSEDFKTMDELVPENSKGYYGGGNPMLNRERELVNSANITMDKETGIGTWTQEEFLNAVKYGQHPKGASITYPMVPHTALTDTEVNAIWAYLQTVPTINNKVERYKPSE